MTKKTKTPPKKRRTRRSAARAAPRAGALFSFRFTLRGRPYEYRPALLPTLFTVFGVLFMAALGSWQVQRLFWKTDLIATRTARAEGPVVALPAPGTDPAAYEFSRVAVTGLLRHDRELYLGARSLNGNLGFHVLTPLQGEKGQFFLIDRGWVPMDKKLPAARAQGQIEGPVRLEGVLRMPGRKGRFIPDNRPAENFWFFVDIPAMAAVTGLGPFYPAFIEAGAAANPGGLPIGGQARVHLPNDHLQYAITWYALAIVLLVIYGVYSTQPRRR